MFNKFNIAHHIITWWTYFNSLKSRIFDILAIFDIRKESYIRPFKLFISFNLIQVMFVSDLGVLLLTTNIIGSIGK